MIVHERNFVVLFGCGHFLLVNVYSKQHIWYIFFARAVIFLSFWAEVHYNSIYPEGGNVFFFSPLKLGSLPNLKIVENKKTKQLLCGDLERQTLGANHMLRSCVLFLGFFLLLFYCCCCCFFLFFIFWNEEPACTWKIRLYMRNW